MKYKTLESMRQTRLMLTEVIIPVGTAMITLEATHPGCVKRFVARSKVKVTNGCKKVKEKLNRTKN